MVHLASMYEVDFAPMPARFKRALSWRRREVTSCA